MADILQQSDAIKASIAEVKTSVSNLEKLYKDALYAVTPDQSARTTADVQKGTEATNKLIHKTKAELDQFKAVGGDVMRRNMAESLTKKFSDILQTYQKNQTDYHDKVKQRMVQKIKIVNPTASDNEIEQSIDNGDANNMIQMQVVGQDRQAAAKNALAYVNERSREIKQLEVSMRELQQLFMDMAILVDSQGALLDVVEDNVNSAVLHTSSGVDSMRGALKSQKSGRKKMYIILIIVAIVIVVILSGSIGGALSRAKKVN